MRVTDVMQTNLRTIRGTDTVGEAIALLAESHVSGVPVVDDHGRLVGVLSNSDILEALAEHTDPEAREAVFEQTVVQEVMTPRPQTINPEATIRDAALRRTKSVSPRGRQISSRCIGSRRRTFRLSIV